MKWKDSEVQFLIDNYEKLGEIQCSKDLNRTVSSIREKANKLKLRLPIDRRPWTDIEDEFLKDTYLQNDVKYCAKLLNRSYHSVKHRANKVLGLKKFNNKIWGEEEKEFLIKYYPENSAEWCSEKLKRSLTSVQKMANKLKINKKWSYKYITPDGYYMLCHDRDNRVLEHRYIMENHLNRKLDSEEIVHHKNGNKLDNSIENLEIMNRSEHIDMHRKDLLNGRK